VTLQQRLVVLLVASLVMLATVIVAGARILLATIAGPVRDLAAAAQAVSRGDLSAPIPAGGAPEIRAMACDVRAMRDRLLADAHSAEQALQALEQHGPAVTALREALTPGIAEISGITVAGRMDAAEGVLAGDWYDLIALSDHQLAVVLGDVAGHGPRSAVLALRLKHALAASLGAGAGPGAALAATSRTLEDLPDELFATVLVVIIDTAADTLIYANAGHPAALLLNRRRAGAGPPLSPGGHVTTVTSTGDHTRAWIDLPSTGPLLSPVVASLSWTQAEHEFHADDTLIAFTDGLLEARDPHGEQFGLPRLLDIINSQDLGDGPRLLDAVAAAVARYTTTRRDDQTLVYAHRTPRLGGSARASKDV
jgi:sigma-B regulation protein RsbU (phosphoserine phosphatase)